jgi:hypothetical protein
LSSVAKFIIEHSVILGPDGRQSDDTHTAYRVAAFPTFLGGRIQPSVTPALAHVAGSRGLKKLAHKTGKHELTLFGDSDTVATLRPARCVARRT